ncbi:hypothetical protein [Rheinheimera faecalis]
MFLIANTFGYIPNSFAQNETSHLFGSELSFESSVPHFYPKKEATLIKRVSYKLEWLATFYKSAKTANLAKDVYPIVKGIRGLFEEKRFDLVDDILAELEIGKLSHTAMVTFLTTTFPAKQKLDNWTLAAHFVKVKLEQDGLNADDVLRGLI